MASLNKPLLTAIAFIGLVAGSGSSFADVKEGQKCSATGSDGKTIQGTLESDSGSWWCTGGNASVECGTTSGGQKDRCKVSAKTNGNSGKPVRHPVNVGVKNPPTKLKTETAVSVEKHGGMDQSGGHHR